MGQIKGVKYGYDDINIVPEKLSDISSRSEVSLYNEDGMLPIITAPMDTVVDENNYKEFYNNSIYPVIPRTCSIKSRIEFWNVHIDGPIFVALSLNEAKSIFIDDFTDTSFIPKEASDALCKFRLALKEMRVIPRVCIDIANGHMKNLLDTIKIIKGKYGPMVKIMAGNIANPETYEEYEKAGCDYVRVSIGTGEGCSTSTNTGIHYPIFSLLQETYETKKRIGGKCKIIADGGIKCFGDVQKALIYADYVMIGGLFSKMIESAGPKFYGKSYWNVRGLKILRPLKTLFTYGKEVKKIDTNKWKNGEIEIFTKFQGMSTVEAQERIYKANGDKTVFVCPKTSEGFTKMIKVETSIYDWVSSEKSYYKSMMSYIGARNASERKDALWIVKQNKNHN